ncbi:MAG: pseudouridine synthase [Fluviicola sp.]|nr:MAG: pseudouridine synthase [Fluviicola sp.]
MKQFKYYAVFKPYDMLCQFTGQENDYLLGDLFDFPKDVYSIGRLDKDSEGLLLMTNDNRFKTKLLEPIYKTPKTYYAQVDGDITAEAIRELSKGSIVIKHKGNSHKVAPAVCCKINDPNFPERSVPIRYRKNIPTSWVSITISEGKNRQVRKMTAAAGFPTLRLVRFSIGNYKLGSMQPGDVVEIRPDQVL